VLDETLHRVGVLVDDSFVGGANVHAETSSAITGVLDEPGD